VSEVTKQIKSWAKKHKWLVDLADDIERVDGLLSAESDANIRYANLVEQIAQAEKRCAELDKYVADAQQAAEDANTASDKHVIANEAVIAQAIESADSEAKTIISGAQARADDIIGDAEREAERQRIEAGAAQKSVAEALSKLDSIRGEYDEVKAAIAQARANAAEAMRAISS
jgi:cell division septum initiation protein DivIVA